MLRLEGKEGFKDEIGEMFPAGHRFADGAKHIQQSHDLECWRCSLLTMLCDL